MAYIPPLLARKLVYFLTMQQIWDYLEVAVENPAELWRRLWVSCAALDRLREGECVSLKKRYKELLTVCEEAKMSGILSYLNPGSGRWH
jgi:hypothetical protein